MIETIAVSSVIIIKPSNVAVAGGSIKFLTDMAELSEKVRGDTCFRVDRLVRPDVADLGALVDEK